MLRITGSFEGTFLGYFFTSNMIAIMALIFSVFLIMILLNHKKIIESFKGVRRNTWIALFLIFILGFVLRNDLYSYGMGFDGLHYQDTANSLFRTGMFTKGCAIGNLDDCRLYNEVLFPAGFPFLIFLLYFIFGQNSLFAMVLNGFLGSLAIIVIYMITYLLFKDERTGLYTALIFALIPVELIISGTGAVRPVSTFFMALSVLFFLIALGKDNVKLWALFSITLSYTIYVRQENSVLLIPMLFLFFTKNRITKKSFEKKSMWKMLRRYWLPVAIFLVSQIPVQFWIIFGNVPFSGSQPLFSSSYVPYTLPAMLTLLFTDYTWIEVLFNPLTSMLLFAGIFFLFRGKFQREMKFLWLWFLVFFLLEALYFQCHGFPDDFCGTMKRHLNVLSLPYAMISGFVLFRINMKIKVNRFAFLALMAVIIIAISGISMPSTLFKDARFEEPYIGDALRAVDRTGRNCLVFVSQYGVPGSDALASNERRWIDMDLILGGTKDLVWEEIRSSECIVYLHDYRCEGYFDGQCRFIQENFDSEFLFEEDSNQSFWLPTKVEAYRLSLKNTSG